MKERQEGGAPPQERTMEDFKRETLERVRAEREKLEQFGRIGQRVKIVGRSISPDGEVVGEIIALESQKPFNDETLTEWEQGDGNVQDLPNSTVKVFVTEGERKGQTVTNLVASEWEPIENK